MHVDCLNVKDKVAEKYLYRSIVYRAACVDPVLDGAQQMNSRIRAAFKAMEDVMVCNGSQFDVKNGNYLKYAVAEILRTH